MARWITFDPQTFSLLRKRLAPGASIETFGRGAVDYALAKPGAVITLLPAFGEAGVAMAIFRRPRPRRTIQPSMPVMPEASQPVHASLPASARSTRAGGFLGLSDEPIYEEAQVEEKKGWWRRFWDE